MLRALGPLPGSTTPRATPSTRERAARPTATPPTTRPPRRRAHRSSVVVASPPSAAHRTRASWTTWFATEDDDEDEAASEEPTKTSWSSRDSGFLDDPIVARPPASPSPLLANADLAPVGARDRTFSAADVAALWIGLVVCVPAYTLAGSLLDLGMSAVEAIGCIMVANALVLIPLVLVRRLPRPLCCSRRVVSSTCRNIRSSARRRAASPTDAVPFDSPARSPRPRPTL
jgi:hypothetical protein